MVEVRRFESCHDHWVDSEEGHVGSARLSVKQEFPERGSLVRFQPSELAEKFETPDPWK